MTLVLSNLEKKYWIGISELEIKALLRNLIHHGNVNDKGREQCNDFIRVFTEGRTSGFPSECKRCLLFPSSNFATL